MPPHHRTTRTTTRRLVAGALGLLWLGVGASQAAPRTDAVPASVTEPVSASFAPVWVDARVRDALPSATTLSVDESPPEAIGEVGRAPIPTSRPAVGLPSLAAGVTAKVAPTTHALRGRASWFCRAGVSPCMAAHPDRAGVGDMFAAAGPGLRRAICGSEASNCWRNRRVLVNGVAVVLVDWCQCYRGQPNEKLIDLYWDAWTRAAGALGAVTIRW